MRPACGPTDQVALEGEVQRRTAAKKYWETHDYDPLTCTYLDDDKEAAFQVRGLQPQGLACDPRAPACDPRGPAGNPRDPRCL